MATIPLAPCSTCGHPEVKHHPTRTETWCIVGMATASGCRCRAYRPLQPREAAERRLPNAEVEYPLCGSCGASTDHDGDTLYCDPCGLDFDHDMTATYRDQEAEPCGAPGEADGEHRYHGRVSTPGFVWECHPCALPAGHSSDHWHGCSVRVAPST